MAHDLVIKNGMLIDGTGADPFRADIVVDDGRITRVDRFWRRRGG